MYKLRERSKFLVEATNCKIKMCIEMFFYSCLNLLRRPQRRQQQQPPPLLLPAPLQLAQRPQPLRPQQPQKRQPALPR